MQLRWRSSAFFITLPQVVAASFSGVLADRWDRRKVLILADAGQAAGTVVLFLLVLSGDLQLWHLYLVTLIQSTFGIFQGPAFQASITACSYLMNSGIGPMRCAR